MEIKQILLTDVLILEPDIHRDERGYFFESFNTKTSQKFGIDVTFKQDNESLSQKNVIRGLHLQLPPFQQGKLVRVICGSVLDVFIDLRKHSPTFLQNTSIVLSGDNKLVAWIPEGFAHGFLTLENNTIFSYKCSNYYNKPLERTILWNDPDFKIDWGVLPTNITLNEEKDENLIIHLKDIYNLPF